MESPNGYRHKWMVAIYEVIGTCFLTFSVVMSGSTFAVAATLLALILICDPISGAHFNSGFSIAVYIKEGKYRYNCGMLAIYVISHIIGAFLGTRLSSICLEVRDTSVP